MIVIADTTPLNYLVLIGQAELLPRLFGRVLIPPAVWTELNDPETPKAVKTWLTDPPAWLQVQTLRSPPDPQLCRSIGVDRLTSALARLQETTFYVKSELLTSLLREDEERKKKAE